MPKVKAKAKVEKKKDQDALTIPPVPKKKAQITIEGDTALMVQRYGEKARRMIEDKQQKKAKQARQARDPQAEFEAALYLLPSKGNKKVYGIPAAGLKNCAVSACRYVEGFTMTIAKGAFHVLGEANGLVPLKCDEPEMDIQNVNIGGMKKISDIRYRPRFDKWECTFTVIYNANVISPEQLLNLYENAGFSVGLCEYRPEKSGSYGMFSVKRK
jgi:hypothetical protein